MVRYVSHGGAVIVLPDTSIPAATGSTANYAAVTYAVWPPSPDSTAHDYVPRTPLPALVALRDPPRLVTGAEFALEWGGIALALVIIGWLALRTWLRWLAWQLLASV
jgi:hypothetical protein